MATASLDLALKDVYRDKKHALAMVGSLAAVAFLFTFLSSVATDLGFVASGGASSLFTVTIRGTYVQYVNVAVGTTFAACTVAGFALAWNIMAHKTRDVGVMKAVGSRPPLLYSFYLKELLVLVAAGFTLGAITGGASAGIAHVVLVGTGLSLQWGAPFLLVAMAFALTATVAFVTGSVLVVRVGKKTVAETLAGDAPYSSKYPAYLSPVPRLLSRLGLTAKIASRNLARRSKEYLRHFAMTTALLAAVVSLVLGVATVGATGRSYFSGAQGSHVVAVGGEDLLEAYEGFYATFRGSAPPNLSVVNLTSSEYKFDAGALASLLAPSLPSGVKFEQRAFFTSNVREMKAVRFFQVDNETYYEYVGQDREASAVVVGLDLEASGASYHVDGELPSPAEDLKASFGDSLASTLFDYPFIQSALVEALGAEYDVGGIVVDSLNQGFTVYVGLDEVRARLGWRQGEANVLLLYFPGRAEPATIEAVKNVVEASLGAEFAVVDLSTCFEENLDAFDSVRSTFLAVVGVLVVLANASTISFQRAGVEARWRDYAVMRALGASERRIRAILWTEGTFLVVPAALFATAVAMLFVQFFLLEGAVIPPLRVPLATFGGLVLILAALNLASQFLLGEHLRDPAKHLRPFA
ncbi:MAG: hypothetical protein Kow0069_23140 [Promethearchaeota archaeon]